MKGFKTLEYGLIRKVIKSSSPQSSIYVGCDSKLSGSHTAFGLAVILHIESNKGGMVFGDKFKVNRRMEIGERILKEVDVVMDCAFTIYNSIGGRNFEVHLDINPDPKYKSNKYVKQAVAYVRAQGFPYRIKPGAWAASTAADYLIS